MKKKLKLVSAVLISVMVMMFIMPAAGAADASITVSVMVIGDTRHASGQHSQYQVWIDKTAYTMAGGASAADLLLAALDDKGMQYQYNALFGGYLTSVTAPSVLGGYKLGASDNGGYSGWLYSTNKPGYHEISSSGMGDYKLSNNEFIVVHYADDDYEIDWSAYPVRAPASWLTAKPLPQDGDSGKGGGSGSNTGGGANTSGTGGAQFGTVSPKAYTLQDLTKQTDTNIYQLTVEKGSVIKSGVLSGLPVDAVFYADIITNERIQFRLKIPSPSDIDADLKPGMELAPDTNAVKKLFSEHYKNKLEVLVYDQTSPWGQTVEIMIYAENIDGFDSGTWKLYSYDRVKNVYIELDYRMDENNYIRFNTNNVNPVVFSNGALMKR